MKLAGLVSGGKDSIYNLLQCIAAGHEVVAIANIEPYNTKEEMDSYMYQTVGHQTLSLVSAALSLPIYRQKTRAIAKCKEKNYIVTPNDEVEDLYTLVARVKDEMHIEGVAVGAIASDYQRSRVESVCSRLNLRCFAYLWMRDQEELLSEMIDSGMHAIIVKVAGLGLKPEVHLGSDIRDMKHVLLALNQKFGIHICGEGGEYETLTLDCPLYYRRIQILESAKVIHSNDAFAPVGYLSIKNATLEGKIWDDSSAIPSVQMRLDYIRKKVKGPMYYLRDILDEVPSTNFEESELEPEVLPCPFQALLSKSEEDNLTALVEPLRSKKDLSQSGHGHSHVVTFSPSSTGNLDTSNFQLNHSTGWFCIGNLTAPNIKEGLNLLKKHLERYQFEFRDLVAVNLYVKDMNEWTKINKIYSSYVSTHCPPTRACMALPLGADIGVLITAVAHRLVSKTQKVVHYTLNTVDKDYVCVQSISHWAPACIGPYSQSIRIGELVYVAGQIPLVPGTMEVLNSSILNQCRLTLRHVLRIIQSLNDNYTMSNIMCGTCFVSSEEIAAEVAGLWSYITKNDHAPIAVIVALTLPRNCDLEWQVLACGYDGKEVSYATEKLSEELTANFKRCRYTDHNTSSMKCTVKFVKKSKKDIKSDVITSENVLTLMRHCVRILRGDLIGSGTPLCMFNVFFSTKEPTAGNVINDTIKACLDFKVVITCVPVVALEEPNILLTVTGVCH